MAQKSHGNKVGSIFHANSYTNMLGIEKPVYIFLIQYAKPFFDLVQHDQPINTLSLLGIDETDLKLIANSYWGQYARINVQGGETEKTPVIS